MRPAIILVPYFGGWPPWFPLYLHSCGLNQEFDWLIIGDAPHPENVPPNVRFLTMPLAAFLAMIGAQTGLDHRAGTTYKVCDFKPVLGAAFAGEIAGHEFFGWGDLDLVYGRLAELAFPLLSDHDVISFARRLLSNYTCLLRNEPQFLHLYRQVPHWQRKLGTTGYCGFDDVDFSRVALTAGRVWNHDCHTTPLVKDCPWIGGGSPPARWTWNHGRVTNDVNPGFQFAFFHFMVWKEGPKRHYHQTVRHWPAGAARVDWRDIAAGRAFHLAETGITAEIMPVPSLPVPFATDLSVPAPP